MSMQLTGGRALVDTLAAHGVEIVFGIPGIHNLALFDALYRHPTIRHITVRHEQGAGFMADGYARVSGKVGVLLTTSGPGATNALTPFAEAYADGSPVLLITTGLDDEVLGREVGELHEMRDQFGLLKSVTGRGARVKSVEEIPATLTRVLAEMNCGRRRPHLLEVPIAICKSVGEAASARVGEPHVSTNPPTHQLEKCADLIRNARRPLIIAGGGTVDCSAEVVALAERLNAPVALTRSSRGVMPDAHPLCLGLGGDEQFKDYLSACDLVLALGTRFGKFWGMANLKVPQLIHLDIDAEVIGRFYPPEVALCGEARALLPPLLDRLAPGPGDDDGTRATIAKLRAERLAAQRRREPRTMALIDALADSIPREAIVVNDMTIVCYSATRFLPVYRPRSFLYPNYFGTLGFSPPAALGAKLACPQRPVVSLCGDGGFLFTVHELATAVMEKIPVTFIVFNDHCYSAIKRAERRAFGERFIGADLRNPDFCLLAESFGVKADRATTPEELARSVRCSFDTDEPRLIELALEIPLSDQ